MFLPFFKYFKTIYYINNEKVDPKVFWVFDFGHFFCPFLKIPEKSWEKIIVVTIIEN
jgi:hypothetical protein